MGQKVNPYGFRLGITTDWKSRWFKDAGYQDSAHEDTLACDPIVTRVPSRKAVLTCAEGTTMHPLNVGRLCGALALCLVGLAFPAVADRDDAPRGLAKVKHVVVLMQENHSFDNYFGALAYAPWSPYHPGRGECREGDFDDLVAR